MPDNKTTVVATGQRWKLAIPKSAVWRVVSVSISGEVGLSGPGPMRSYKQVTLDELERLWELVKPKSKDEG